jgi:hypothetical protein
MEINSDNYIDTTSSITLNSSTLSASNIFNRDIDFQWISDQFNNDLTTSSITFSFDETLPVDRIILDGINFKDFTVYYNGTTANTFAITTTSATTVSDFSTNSETAMVLKVNRVQCTSVSIDITATQTTDAEKAIGYCNVCAVECDFERVPSSSNYKPKVERKQNRHVLSDGGVRLFTVGEKAKYEIKFKHITTTFRDQLKTIWDSRETKTFIPFPTMAGWDALAHEVVWPGGFEFYKYSDDAQNAGFSGKIKLEEVTR